MKIALCLSGHMRTHVWAHQFWQKNLLSLYDVDVFIHTWDTVGPRSFGKYSTEHNPVPREDYNSGILSSPEINISEVISTWNPKQFVVDAYADFHDTFQKQIVPILNERDRRGIPAGFEHHHPLSVRSMLYKRFVCNQLKIEYEQVNNMKYDLVIQTRPDIVLTSPISDDILHDHSLLYFHNCRSVTPDPEINDFGCIGSSENIDVWCDLYNKIDLLFSILQKEQNFFKFLNPHKMYYQYLLQENRAYKELDINLSIVRDSGIILGWPHAQQLIQEVMYHES
jgi:hypothetical protein